MFESIVMLCGYKNKIDYRCKVIHVSIMNLKHAPTNANKKLISDKEFIIGHAKDLI